MQDLLGSWDALNWLQTAIVAEMIDEYDSKEGALKNLEDVRCHSQFIQQAARWIILYHIIRILLEYIKNLLSYHI